MKTISESLNEALKDSDKGVIQMLQFFGQNCSGCQQQLYQQMVKDADSVDIVSVYDIFTEEEIQQIKKYVRPKPKMCYENAYKLADVLYTRDIKYVEGYLNMKGLPIEHAFNCVDGKYCDITIELALGRDVHEDTYIKIGEWDVNDVREVLIQNGYYGQIYQTKFLNSYKENIK